MGAFYDFEGQEIGDYGDGSGDDDGADEGGPEDVEGFPGKEAVVIEGPDGESGGEAVGAGKEEEADLELPA